MAKDEQLVWDFREPAALDARAHGGRRRGAGRRAVTQGKRRAVPHRTRPEHGGRYPVHVTMRAVGKLPSLRNERIRNLLLRAISAQSRRLGNFRVVHFSIQRDHLHLVLEAGVPLPCAPQLVLPLEEPRPKGPTRSLTDDAGGGSVDGGAHAREEASPEALLRSGMIGLATSLARRLNRMLGRRGKVWDGRHHRRDLESPTAVRRALLYVLQNHVHHGLARPGALDRFSTASEFPVWTSTPRPAGGAASGALDASGFDPSTSQGPPGRAPRSWLLRTGWQRAGGLLRRHEVPS